MCIFGLINKLTKFNVAFFRVDDLISQHILGFQILEGLIFELPAMVEYDYRLSLSGWYELFLDLNWNRDLESGKSGSTIFKLNGSFESIYNGVATGKS